MSAPGDAAPPGVRVGFVLIDTVMLCGPSSRRFRPPPGAAPAGSKWRQTTILMSSRLYHGTGLLHFCTTTPGAARAGRKWRKTTILLYYYTILLFYYTRLLYFYTRGGRAAERKLRPPSTSMRTPPHDSPGPSWRRDAPLRSPERCPGRLPASCGASKPNPPST